jgi:hypothetical protein
MSEVLLQREGGGEGEDVEAREALRSLARTVLDGPASGNRVPRVSPLKFVDGSWSESSEIGQRRSNASRGTVRTESGRARLGREQQSFV